MQRTRASDDTRVTELPLHDENALVSALQHLSQPCVCVRVHARVFYRDGSYIWHVYITVSFLFRRLFSLTGVEYCILSTMSPVGKRGTVTEDMDTRLSHTRLSHVAEDG